MRVFKPMIAYAMFPSGIFDNRLFSYRSKFELKNRLGTELPNSDRDLLAYLDMLYASALKR